MPRANSNIALMLRKGTKNTDNDNVISGILIIFILILTLFKSIMIDRKKVIIVSKEKQPQWLTLLSQEDFEFIRQFILSSGSLKEMASYYQISYPTIRSRLDKLIQKIASSPKESDDFVDLIKQFALDGEMSYDVAKTLINTYREEKR